MMSYPNEVHVELEARSTIFFAIAQLLVGIGLIVEDSVAYAIHEYDLAYNLTARGAGFWSGSMLTLSFVLGLYGLIGEYKRCPVISSLVLSVVGTIDGCYAFCVFLYVIITKNGQPENDRLNYWDPEIYNLISPAEWRGFTIIHVVLYACMCTASSGQAVICFRNCCAHRQVPPGTSVQYVMAPTGEQQPVQVVYHHPGQQMYK